MSKAVRRALVSVFDKEGIGELCRTLADQDVEILSSGGTARMLKELEIPVTLVSDYTGFPEMLDGRVKTLHPRIHAGILAVRDNAEHMADLQRSEIEPIDLVVVNLYPFQKTAATNGIDLDEVVEMIDIGGPALVRAAAKNFAHVGVVVDPADYRTVAEELQRDGALSYASRVRLSARAFQVTSAYDQAVQVYLTGVGPDGRFGDADSALPDRLHLAYDKQQGLRYGENPHQRAAFYVDPLSRGPSVGRARQLQGKELSFNNILDLDSALGLVTDFERSACAIIKHGNPCGTALGSDPANAFAKALECDPLSAFGGVIAFNRRVDRRSAERIAEHFFEGVIAPEFDDEALAVLARKKRLRLLTVGKLNSGERSGLDLRRVAGGLLVQDWDLLRDELGAARVVSSRQPSEEEWKALDFAWTVAKHVKSNAIVYAGPDRTLGIGAGQMSRVDSARLGVEKAQSPLEGSVLASDAFFPFRDGIDAAAAAGVRAVIQPGGSKRDAEVIDAADEHGLAMVFTGRRHFRH